MVAKPALPAAIASNKLVVLLKKTTKDVVAGGKIPFFDTLPILTKLLLVRTGLCLTGSQAELFAVRGNDPKLDPSAHHEEGPLRCGWYSEGCEGKELVPSTI